MLRFFSLNLKKKRTDFFLKMSKFKLCDIKNLIKKEEKNYEII